MSLPCDERYMAPGTVARVRVDKPDDVRLSFQLSMTAAEWRHLMRQLPDDGSAAGQLHKMIRGTIGLALDALEPVYLVSPYAGAKPEEPAK